MIATGIKHTHIIYHYFGTAVDRVSSLVACSTADQGIELLYEEALFIHWLSRNQVSTEA